MVLNHEQIKNEKLIQNSISENFDNASYDLRIDKLITVGGSVKKKLNIEPNSMVVAISKETAKLPKNIIGHAFVKTRLSQRGIMANNIGVIDPGYEGPLSSVLVNFGKEAYELKENEIFLRLTFSTFNEPSENIPIEYGPFERKEYETNKRADTIEYLGNAFIDIEKSIKNKVKSSLAKMITNFGLWAIAF
ncbi:MAG: dCTP deaminase domain-containing protein, partial [Marinirhabdus sp.]